MRKHGNLVARPIGAILTPVVEPHAKVSVSLGACKTRFRSPFDPWPSDLIIGNWLLGLGLKPYNFLLVQLHTN